MSVGTKLDSENLIGRVLGGKFRLRNLIGAGASGTVYQADQTALGRTVAVKILNPELADDPRLVNRFHEEALLASRLNHPNTVSVIDYGQTEDGLLYIVMEYLRGLTLTQVIAKESPLADARIVDIMGQILAGLEEAHHSSVIHADLKSDNVVVEHRRGGWDLVKVVDFGIARLVGTPRAEEARRTICGTPEYMAPELISGEDPTVASDLYAVGIVLYEILCGQTPFVGGSTLDVLRRQLRQEPVLPALRRPDRRMSDSLQSITLRALAKNPADRFSTALEFRNALEKVTSSIRKSTDLAVRCEGCGVSSSASFKFCPECGHRMPSGQVVTPMSDGSTEPYQVAQELGKLPTLLDQRETSDLDMTIESSPLGILPLPLMGRTALIADLVRFATQPGDAAVCQLAGSAGSGRTRLLGEVRRRLGADESIAVYSATADPTGLKTPYFPIRHLVASAMSLPAACSYDNLSAALEALGLTRRDLPGIAELFGHHGELWQLEPEVRRRELFASTVRVLVAASAQKRAVLLLDDVDAYDVPSRELLAHLADVKSTAPLRVIATHRSLHTALWPATVARFDIPLFASEELAAVASHLQTGGQTGMPDGEALTDLTGGNPCHIDHLVRFVVEGGEVADAPRAIADLVAERVKQLPHLALVVSQAVAVFGTEVSRDALDRMLHDRPGIPRDDAISVLKARGLFTVKDGGDTVAFSHQLTRDVIYDSTPADVRRELHALAIDYLTTSGPDPLLLGHHHDMAGHLEDAASLLMEAGDDSVHQLDDSGATILYQRAQAAARTLMLQSNELEYRILFVTLSVRLAEALRAGDEIALARGVVEEAKGYCDGAPNLSAQLWRVSAHLHVTEGKLDRAIDTMRRAIGLLIPVGQMELLAEFYLDLSSMYERKGDVQSAIMELVEGIDLVTLGEGGNATAGPESLWRLLHRQARLQGSLEKHQQALPLAESALIHARRVRSRIGSAKVQTLLASYYEKLGNHELAQRYGEAAVNEMRRLGDRRGTAELLLAGMAPTRTLLRVTTDYLREARELADEVGWAEGVQQALERIR